MVHTEGKHSAVGGVTEADRACQAVGRADWQGDAAKRKW